MTSKRHHWRHTPEYARLVRRQLRREPCCRACGSGVGLEVDHITPVAHGGSIYDLANIQTLCSKCHRIKTSAQLAAPPAKMPDEHWAAYDKLTVGQLHQLLERK